MPLHEQMFTVGAFLQTKQLLTIKKSQGGRIFSQKINFFCTGIHRESIIATKGQKWERVYCSLSRTAEVKNCLSVSTERSGKISFSCQQQYGSDQRIAKHGNKLRERKRTEIFIQLVRGKKSPSSRSY